ncbi:sialic acid TRAP transporter substrate-binding protein SiaP [Treponema socranskii]|uniref:sialic acid TRAP transporter substrate-binding protein SiaP n=1 Tax=Treponema socranskii TaxID=53419 RepID=UPI003D944DF4
MKKVIWTGVSVLLICGLATARVNKGKQGQTRASTNGKPVTIRWASVHPVDHPASQMMVRVANEVSQQTKGRVEIKTFPASQLGTDIDLVHGTQTGSIDMVSTGAASFGLYAPLATITEAPYIWRNIEHLEKALNGPFGQKVSEELTNSGMRLLGAMYYGTRHLSTSTKEVHSVADCAGMRIRVPESDIFVAMAHSWGSNSRPITFSELYIALQYNIVDAQENPLPTFASAKFQEVQKYVILTGHIMTPLFVVINENTWQKLDPADREIVQASLAKNIEWQNGEIIRQERELIATLKSQGITIITPDVESFRVATLKTLPSMFEAKWGKGTWESIQSIQ